MLKATVRILTSMRISNLKCFIHQWTHCNSIRLLDEGSIHDGSNKYSTLQPGSINSTLNHTKTVPQLTSLLQQSHRLTRSTAVPSSRTVPSPLLLSTVRPLYSLAPTVTQLRRPQSTTVNSGNDYRQALLHAELLTVLYLCCWPINVCVTMEIILRSQVSSGSIVLTTGDQGSIPGKGKLFFLYPLCPDQLWCPPNLLSSGYWGSFPQG
jgi:hypothetical protein